MFNLLRRLLSRKGLRYAAELSLLILLAMDATSRFRNFDPTLRVSGQEIENLTTSGYYLHTSFQTLGYVPYWQPYSNSGQPLVDEAYSFIVNPFSYIPILLFGDNNGIKVSIILHFMLEGVGGWFLGYTLGMGGLGRLFLGALLIVKGNMQAVIGNGFYQLGIAQAYFPWVLAGAFAIARNSAKRWTPVLLAVALALTFYCGEIYFILPIVLLCIIVFGFYTFRLSFKPLRVHIDFTLIRRIMVAALLTAGLIAVSALTIVLNFHLIGQHPDQTQFASQNVLRVFWQFVHPGRFFWDLFHENFYSYIIPIWFPLVIFILLPPLRFLHHSAEAQKDKRLWFIAIVALVFFTVWGLSVKPIVPWIYANIPLIAQWRFPERMLAVSSFLLIFLMAFRIDGLHRALVRGVDYRKYRRGSLIKLLVSGTISLTTIFAILEVYLSFYRLGYLTLERDDISACVSWLRTHYPDQFLSVTHRDFYTMSTFIRNGVRMESIGAAYHIGGVESELYPYDLTGLDAEFYMPAWDEPLSSITERGLIPVYASPIVSRENPIPCIWRNPDAISYAFSVSINQLRTADFPLPKSITTPVTYLGRTPEHIWLEVAPLAEEQVVVVQEVAYPGWIVKVNGNESSLESVGQLLGVIIPVGDTPHLVEFIYTAPTLKLGGMITLVTASGLLLYLLRVDKVISRFRRRFHT